MQYTASRSGPTSTTKARVSSVERTTSGEEVDPKAPVVPDFKMSSTNFTSDCPVKEGVIIDKLVNTPLLGNTLIKIIFKKT